MPRPANIGEVPAEYYQMSVEPQPSQLVAEKLLLDEVVQLTKHDAHAHPVPHDNGILSVLDLTTDQASSSSTTKDKKSKKKSKKRKLTTQSIPLDFLPEDALLAARTLLEDATQDILNEQRLLLRNSLTDPDITEQELDDALTAQNVTSSRTGATATTNDTQTPTELATLTQATSLLTKRATKLQTKLTVQLGGYSTKASQISTELLQHYAEYRHVCIEQEVFTNMFQREKRVIPQRIQRLQEEVNVLEVRERVGQKKYGDLMLERNRRKVLELKQSRDGKTVAADGAGAAAGETQ
uniref:Uncharacterized protein n=1 Tax=Proboscia inermis TaxID=420281 RepID=A0A6T8GS91_9STRA